MDGKVVFANANSSVIHTSTVIDPDNNLQEPKSITHTWSGTSCDGRDISAEIKAVFPAKCRDRIDVFEEMPKFLKEIVAAATGIRPYIYQVGNSSCPLRSADVMTECGRSHSCRERRRCGEERAWPTHLRSGFHVIDIAYHAMLLTVNIMFEWAKSVNMTVLVCMTAWRGCRPYLATDDTLRPHIAVVTS